MPAIEAEADGRRTWPAPPPRTRSGPSPVSGIAILFHRGHGPEPAPARPRGGRTEAHNWSAKVEYDYLGLLSSQTFTVPAGSPFLAGDIFTTAKGNIQMVKFGINYKFGIYGM
jgi:hypothetical protein